MKLKTIYVCSDCGFQSPKWLGKCSDCGAWNSFCEDVVSNEKQSVEKRGVSVTPLPLSQVQVDDLPRIVTGIKEWDRVTGEGVVPGSLILLGGEPGIGKSTLMLQVCSRIGDLGKRVLYVSGEESPHQVSLRAKRLNSFSENVSLVPLTQLESILATIESHDSDFVIIDSIQVIASDSLSGGAGTVSQIRYCTEALMHLAKSKNLPILIVGHVTKDGVLAGPKVLEHLVDTVMYIEGDRYHNLRLLRCVKNRFGATSEVGVFQMEGEGLVAVENPADYFLNELDDGSFGSALTMTVEGSRAFLVEVQALTNTTSFGYPKRTATGFDLNRLQLIIAILEKHAGVNLQNQDVFVNVAGGYKLNDPACDLSVAMAIVSAFYGKSILKGSVFLGELGLTGEVRLAAQIEKRLKEAKELGFEKAYSAPLRKALNGKTEIIQSRQIGDLVRRVFAK